VSVWESIRYWWNNQSEIDVWRANYDTLLELFSAVITTRGQIKFLLDNAPLLKLGKSDYELRSRLRASTIAFAYVHPKTMGSLFAFGQPVSPYIEIPGSPTKWILTEWLLVDTVIFSPQPMPGIDVR
jgi:hypothetical protein